MASHGRGHTGRRSHCPGRNCASAGRTNDTVPAIVALSGSRQAFSPDIAIKLHVFKNYAGLNWTVNRWLVTWLVTHSRFVNRVIIYERSLILFFFFFCFVVCSIFFWMCVIRLGEGSVDKFGVELVGLIGKSLI